MVPVLWTGTCARPANPQSRTNPDLATGDEVDILHRPRQGQRGPSFTPILRAENLALIASAYINLVGIGLMQSDRHNCAVRLDLVKALPGPTGIVAAIDATILARRGNA